MSEDRGREEQGTHPVDELLPPGRMAAFRLQHVMTMYAGIIAVPLIVATALDLPADQIVYIINASFFMCGVATLIQAVGFWKFGAKLPIVQGTSFAAVTPMIIIGGEYGIQGIYGSVIVAALLTVIAAPFFGKFLRFSPPVVTGTIIAIIGVSLMPVAIRWAAAGVQTLSKVDLTLNRNLIIVAVAVALGVIPATMPEFYEAFPEAVRLVFDSGITAAAVAAILLNILFNVLGGESEQDVGDYGENVGGVEDKLTVVDANRLDREAFADKFAPLFQGSHWVAEEAYDAEHPFYGIHDLRHAFQTVVYDAPEECQAELLRSYTPLSKQATARESLSTLSVRERRSVGPYWPLAGGRRSVSADERGLQGEVRLPPDNRSP